MSKFNKSGWSFWQETSNVVEISPNIFAFKKKPLETVKLCEGKQNISPQFIYKMVDKKRRTMLERLLDDI